MRNSDLQNRGLTIRKIIYSILITGIIIWGYFLYKHYRYTMHMGEGRSLAAGIAEAQRLFYVENGVYRDMIIPVQEDRRLGVDSGNNKFFKTFITTSGSPGTFSVKVMGSGEYKNIMITASGGVHGNVEYSTSQLIE